MGNKLLRWLKGTKKIDRKLKRLSKEYGKVANDLIESKKELERITMLIGSDADKYKFLRERLNHSSGVFIEARKNLVVGLLNIKKLMEHNSQLRGWLFIYRDRIRELERESKWKSLEK